MAADLVFSSGDRPRLQGCLAPRSGCLGEGVNSCHQLLPSLPRPSSKVETSLTFLVIMTTQIPTKNPELRGTTWFLMLLGRGMGSC